MISVKSSHPTKYVGLEEMKQHTKSIKTEYSQSKGLHQSTHVSSTQPSNQHTLKDLDLDKKIKQFQNSLLNVKGADVLSQNQQLLSPKRKQEGNSNLSQFSSQFSNSLATTGVQGGRNRYGNSTEKLNQKRLRRIVKDFKGQIIDTHSSMDKKEPENVFQSVYNQDYHKNFVKNSSLIGFNMSSTYQDSPLSQLKSFGGGYDNNSAILHNNNVNDTLGSPSVRNNLKLLRNSLNTNTYDQVVNTLISTKMPPKRSNSNNIFKKNFLKPLQKEDLVSLAELKNKLSNESVANKDLLKVKKRSVSQEVLESKIRGQLIDQKQKQKDKLQSQLDLLQQQHQQQQQQQQKYDSPQKVYFQTDENQKDSTNEVSEFDNLLTEVKQDEKTTLINDEDVISQYQLTVGNKQITTNTSINNDRQLGSSLASLDNLTAESTLTHEQEMLQYLMQTQPQFFDHKAGRCLCALCSCGACITKCKQLSSHLETHLKQHLTSTYRQSFKPKLHELDNKSIDSLNQLKMAYKSQMESQPELFSSTTKNDYQLRDSLEATYKIQKRKYIENKAPISTLSTYNSQYVNWGNPHYEIIRQSQQKTVLDKLPFSHLTTYEDMFKKRFEAAPTQICHPRDNNPLPSIGLFLGESTTQRQFNGKSSSFFQLPKKRQQTPPGLIPSYNGQFKSEQQKAFEGQIQKCKARELLKQQYLERLQVKNINKKDASLPKFIQ